MEHTGLNQRRPRMFRPVCQVMAPGRNLPSSITSCYAHLLIYTGACRAPLYLLTLLALYKLYLLLLLLLLLLVVVVLGLASSVPTTVIG